MNRIKNIVNEIPMRMTGTDILIICSILYEGFIVVELGTGGVLGGRSNEIKKVNFLNFILCFCYCI